MNPPPSHAASAPTGPDDLELIERLRGPEGPATREALIARLAAIEQRLAHQAGVLQSVPRMKQIQAARLAVQNASVILNRVKVDTGGASPGIAPALHQLFRSSPHDQ